MLRVCVGAGRRRWIWGAGPGSAPSHLGNTNQVQRLLPPPPPGARWLWARCRDGRSRSVEQGCGCADVSCPLCLCGPAGYQTAASCGRRAPCPSRIPKALSGWLDTAGRTGSSGRSLSDISATSECRTCKVGGSGSVPGQWKACLGKFSSGWSMGTKQEERRSSRSLLLLRGAQLPVHSAWQSLEVRPSDGGVLAILPDWAPSPCGSRSENQAGTRAKINHQGPTTVIRCTWPVY